MADGPAMLPATTYGKPPYLAKSHKSVVADKSLNASHRLSMTSNSAGGKRLSISLEGSVSSRPSGIPRPTRISSSARKNPAVPSKPVESNPVRTRPSPNITGTAMRTNGCNHSTVRAVRSNSTPRIVPDEDTMVLEPTLPSLDMEHDTVLGIVLPQKQTQHTSNLPPRLIPELQALAATTYRKPTPAMSTISTFSSPSTQFTASPSPWSASTTTTTPTSWSSASPCIVQSTSKRSHTVPLPSKPRTRLPNLPVLQESAASSASSSKANIRSESPPPLLRKSRKKTPLNSPAPTPPPRTSSVKRSRSRSGSKSEDQPILSTQSAPPLPREQDVSPTLKHIREVAIRQTHAHQTQTQVLADNHQKLQHALNRTPSAPIRDENSNGKLTEAVKTNAASVKPVERGRQLLAAAPIKNTSRSDSQHSSNSTKVPQAEPIRSSSRSRSRLAKFSRLAFFGKSSKNVSADSETSRQTRKLQRRGPAAGTGHEGYGRFGRREKRASRDGYVTGTESESSVASTEPKPKRSVSKSEGPKNTRRDRLSQSDLDEFVADKLKPVVIVGGSKKQVSDLHAASTLPKSTISIEKENEQVPQDETNDSRHIGVPSSGPMMRESRLMFHLDSLEIDTPSQLALRRSQKFETPDEFPVLQPINTAMATNLPYPHSYNTSQSSIAPTSAALTDASGDLHRLDSQLSEKQRKKSRRLNWGFFRRKESNPESYQPLASNRALTPKMAVTISAVPPTRPMPYYAVLESESDVAHTETISEFLTEAARAMPAYDEHEPVSPLEESESDYAERPPSILLPKTPCFEPRQQAARSDNNADTHEETKPQTESASLPQVKSRQPRLAQVGRIPKVITTTQKEHFSQLSSSKSDQARLRPIQHALAKTVPLPPVLAINTKVAPARLIKTTGVSKSTSTTARPVTTRSLSQSRGSGIETLRLGDRYSTTSSSSDGAISVMGPPLLPAPDFPVRSIRSTTTEDDIWNEYDDFIDRVISPPRLKKSKTRITDEDRTPSLSARSQAPVEKHQTQRQILKELAVDTSLAPPPRLFTSPKPMDDKDSESDFHLRRSRIISALHSSMDPSSPFSIGDYLAELGEHHRQSARDSGQLSDSTISQSGFGSPLPAYSFPEPPVSQAEYKHYANALHMDESERSRNPAKHSERSYASLMVSRWLSFGRVLFSPAHSDIQKLPERHVLVIDGLGSEDWSIYCAVTYQNEQAYIYDLKETGHTRSSTSSTKDGGAPQNFRRRELTSFDQIFNFPDNFFSVIVLRFPPVMAESKLKNIVAECRRVLALGGYMELMLLDLDIVNMGVLTRRAMRELKTQIAMHNREVSLKPVIDNIQSVLGEKGFSKLSKCIVGVPVVGKPPGAESPTSSRSSGSSDRFRRGSSAGPRPFEGLQGQYHHNFSLNDLVADHSDNADAKIGRVVSRTARSWWQHCFEAAVISDGNLSKSIFANKQVLNECKSRASSFKLLIAYAQKPMTSAVGTKRRTMSEPVMATLATAKTP